MSSAPLNHPRAAYFEDYNEDARTTMPETRQSANIGHKRSKPEVAKAQVVITKADEASDSGYSSQVGPGTSNDSSLESRVASMPAVENQAATLPRRDPSPEKAAPHITKTKNKSGLKALMSRARGDGKSGRQKACECKDCTQNTNAKMPSTKVVPQGSKTPKATAKRAPTPKVVSKPQPIAPPQRPATTKPAIITPAPPRPAQPRPVPVTTQSHRIQRPTSYHAGATQQYYMAPMLVQQSVPTYGRPLQFPTPSYSAAHSYFPQIPAQPPPQPGAYSLPATYAAQPRPQMRQWTSEQPQIQQQQQVAMVYPGPPIAEHPPPQPSLYVATAPVAQPVPGRQSIQLESPTSPINFGYTPMDEDYYKMPPPPIPRHRPTSFSNHVIQRPAIRHSMTANPAYVPLQRVPSKPEEHALYHQQRSSQQSSGQSSPRKPLSQDYPPSSRRPSVSSRPSASSDKKRESISAYELERSMARLSMESGDSSKRERRRMSYYGHETPGDLERVVEAYQADIGRAAAVTPAPRPPTASAQTASARQMPLTPDNLKLVRKKTGSRQASDTGSKISDEMRSKRSSRISTSSSHQRQGPRSSTDQHHRIGGSETKHRTEKTADGITMRFDPNQEVNFDLSGTQGRTISLRQSKESAGQMEFSIGRSTSTRGREKQGDSSKKTGSSDGKTREKSRRRIVEYVDQDGRVLRQVEVPVDDGKRSKSRRPREEDRSERSGRSGRSGRK